MIKGCPCFLKLIHWDAFLSTVRDTRDVLRLYRAFNDRRAPGSGEREWMTYSHRLELNPGCCGEDTEFVHVVHQMLKVEMRLPLTLLTTIGQVERCSVAKCIVVSFYSQSSSEL